MLTTEYMDEQAVVDYKQAASGAAGVLNAAKLIFGTNDITPSKTSVVADITQSVDANLAPVAVTWGAASRDAGGDIVTLTTPLPVSIVSDANACNIKCWGLTNSAGSQLLMCEQLETPIPLTDTLSLFYLAVPFAPGNPQGKQAVVFS